MQGLIAQQHFADDGFGMLGQDDDRFAVLLDVGDRRQTRQELRVELRNAADAAAGDAVLDLGGRAFANDAAFVDDHDAMGEHVGLFEIMRGQQHGFAGSRERANLIPERAAGFDVHADGGLVEEDQVRIAAKRQREEGPLLLAAGELAEHLVCDAVDLRDAHDFGRGQRIGIVAAEEVDVLADAQHLRHAGDLQHGADAGAGVGVAGIAAEHAGGAGVGEMRPSSRRTAVVFPAPLGPSRATTSPARSSMEKLSRAVICP